MNSIIKKFVEDVSSDDEYQPKITRINLLSQEDAIGSWYHIWRSGSIGISNEDTKSCISGKSAYIRNRQMVQYFGEHVNKFFQPGKFKDVVKTLDRREADGRVYLPIENTQQETVSEFMIWFLGLWHYLVSGEDSGCKVRISCKFWNELDDWKYISSVMIGCGKGFGLNIQTGIRVKLANTAISAKVKSSRWY